MSTRRELANAIRALSMDAVQKANSGHPGMPMGMADIAEVLWNDFLRFNPQNPNWENRDRFVLSNGHGSMLLYSVLHLTGYDLSLDDIKHFRQLHSRTPGHPEHGMTPGVEATTGPLGQGVSNAVGMAIAERMLAQQFNREGYTLIDHYTYVFVGDGCLMEGISHEVCSLAGTLALEKLIVFWDDNGVSIDGHVVGWFTEDTPARFEAYGWHVIRDVDGYNPDSIRQAILEAHTVKNKPTFICCKTVIGYGAPTLADTAEAHGAPLGEKEIAAAREKLNWHSPPFEIPKEIYQGWNAQDRGNKLENDWKKKFADYEKAYPELAKEFVRRMKGNLPSDWNEKTQEFIRAIQVKGENIASRKASLNCLNAYGPLLPELVGGSADLTGSNLTLWSGSKTLSHETPSGNYIYYGVREFGMFAIMNGMALHGGCIPYGGTFLTFVDYGRNAVRMAAIMKLRVIFVFTHDSIGLGEDGPTHQPIEQLSMLRLTPGLSVWRPCDGTESAVAWKLAIERHNQPTCLLFSRQTLPHQSHDPKGLKMIEKGGYTLLDCEGTPEAIIIATGSEVSLAIDAAKLLSQQGKKIRVVSMPSTDTFDAQPLSYKQSVLPHEVTRRLAVEAAAPDYWYKYVGQHGKILGLNHYGESAPAADVFKAVGLTVDNIIKIVNELITFEFQE